MVAKLLTETLNVVVSPAPDRYLISIAIPVNRLDGVNIAGIDGRSVFGSLKVISLGAPSLVAVVLVDQRITKSEVRRSDRRRPKRLPAH